MKKLAKQFLHIFLIHATWIFSLILILICYLIYFHNLDQITLRMWDESRNAVNALEMTQNGNLLVTYYNDAPDMWNTKPPLLIWLIAISMKIFGFTEFALRLPSALAATATTFIIFYFIKKYSGDLKIALLSSLILLTSIGYTGMHIARAGDYDALLTLWITLYSLAYFLFIQNSKKQKYLYLFVFFVILAVLTKGIAGMLPLFGLLLYTVYSKKLKQLLLLKSFYYSTATFLFVVLGYYLLRNYFNPGYIEAVLKNELTGRYLSINENHVGGFWQYITDLARYRFVPWIFFMPLSFLVLFLSRNERLKRFIIFGLFYSLSFLLVISSAKTKLFWYDAPFYPIASIIVAIGIMTCSTMLINKFQLRNQLAKTLLVVVLLTGLLIVPLKNSIRHTNQPYINDMDPQIDYATFLKSFMRKNKKIKDFVFLDDAYNAQMLFYAKAANTHGYNIKIKKTTEDLRDFKTILTCDPAIKEKITTSYLANILKKDNACAAYSIY